MQTNIREMLLVAYGPLMDAKAICKVLYYPSVAALQVAKSRRQLPFFPVEIKGRRGLFAMTDDVAELLIQAAAARSNASLNSNHSSVHKNQPGTLQAA